MTRIDYGNNNSVDTKSISESILNRKLSDKDISKISDFLHSEICHNKDFIKELEDNFTQSISNFSDKLSVRLQNLNDTFAHEKEKWFKMDIDKSQYKSLSMQSQFAFEQLQKIDILVNSAKNLGVNLPAELLEKIKLQKEQLLKINGGLGDNYKGGVTAIENSNEISSYCMESLLANMDFDQSVIQLVKLHNSINARWFNSDSESHSNSILVQKINSLIAKKLSQINDPKLKKEKAILFVKIITGRNNIIFSDVNKSLQDPVLAAQILSGLLKDKGGAFETISEKENIHIQDKLLLGKPSDIFKAINEFPKGKAIIKAIGFADLSSLQDGDSYDKLSMEQKIKISVLNSFILRIKTERLDISNLDLQGISVLFQKITTDTISRLYMPVEQQLGKGFFGKSSKDYNLIGADAEILGLYQNIVGNGILVASDNTTKLGYEGAKMVGVIGASILAGIAMAPVTGGTSVVAGGAVIGTAVGATSALASSAIMGKGYDTFDGFAIDKGTEFLLAGFTGGVSGGLAGKFLKSGAELTSKEGLIRLGNNALVNAGDISIGVGSESARQKYLLGNDISLNDMIVQGGLSASIVLLVSRFKGEKNFFKHLEGAKDNLDYDVKGGKLVINGVKKDGKIITDSISPEDEDHITMGILRLIMKNDIKEIEIGTAINMEGKRILNDIVSRNFPLVEIMRLIPGHDVVNFTYGGIKPINDKYGQSFTDLIVNEFKKITKSNFDRYNANLAQQGEQQHGRLIRDAYKNTTYSLPNGDINNIFFGGATNKSEIIGLIIANMKPQIEQIAKEKGLPVEYVIKDIKKNFDFGVGISKVKDGEISNVDKLIGFYESEIIARQGLGIEAINAVRYDVETIKGLALEALDIRDNILSKWKGKKFKLDGVEYDVVVKPFFGKETINPVLLRNIRKGNKVEAQDITVNIDGKPMMLNLSDQVDKYIKTLNRGFDFILPSRVDDLNGEIDSAKVIDKDFKDGKISADTMKKNYKGTESKAQLFEGIEGKAGMRLFIDIKDMGLMNLASFERLAESVRDGNFTSKDLIESGYDVTASFIKFVADIKKAYPNTSISLGGDEVFIFIQGATPAEKAKILNDISNMLKSQLLEGRITHSFETKNSKAIFDKLDKSTKINKFFEEKFESIITQHNIQEAKAAISTISVDLDQSLKNIISSDNLGKILFRDELEGIIRGLYKKDGSLSSYKLQKNIDGNIVEINFENNGNGLLNIQILRTN